MADSEQTFQDPQYPNFPPRMWRKLGWKCRLRRHKSTRMQPIGGQIGPVELWTLCDTCGVIGSDRSRTIGTGSPEFQEAMRNG